MPSSTATTLPKREYGGGWKNPFEDLECPSGEWCQVRRPDPQGLITAGILDELDSLTGAVANETIPKAEGSPLGVSLPELKEMAKTLEAMDKVIMHIVVQPQLHPKPALEEQRDPDLVYIDYVSLDDKAFLLSYAMGGNRSLERFREGSPEAVGSVPAG